jgi:non-specific serine/threonine protein kinase
MQRESSETHSVRDVAISLERGCLLRDGQEIRLRAKTFQVLAYLHQHQGQLVAKEDLFRAVWPDTFVSDDSLTKCVREIREGLGDHDHRLLKTVARRGFILDAPLAVVSQTGVVRTTEQSTAPGQRLHNLPAPLTSFVGRQRQIAELTALLPTTRLLTLTGAGGCGKTRLALELAHRVHETFPDGVWLIDLAPLTEPTLVAQTVASVLDIRQAANRSLIETLSDQLRPRRTLLVLDNCEHLIASSAELAETLLRSAASLTILATSREALRIAGETMWRVPSLTLPDPEDALSPEDLLQYEAVRLLAERAAAIDSGFAMTGDNARTVADVCRRLDGIPLAIELAAARLNVLSIEQINARLDDRFRLLARAPRAPLGRQRTLEATVDWSYELLSDTERHLLRRLSSFAGGWTLDAAEQVCSGDGIDRDDVLELLSHLIDKSLVIVDEPVDGGRRYRCLETVRQYGMERLRQSGEAAAMRSRHFDFFLDLARRAEPELTRASQLRWLALLDRENDNLRAALDWHLSSEPPGAEGLDLAISLHWYWLKRANLAEGLHWLDRAFGRSVSSSPAQQAQALMSLGSIVFFLGDFERAQALLEESARLAQPATDPATAAFALGLLTMVAMERGNFGAAATWASEAVAAARTADTPWLGALPMSYFAYEALYAGDIGRAGRLHEEVLALLRARGELWGIAITLYDLALVRNVQQRHEEARALCREGITIGRQFGDQRAIAWCLGMMAGAEAAEGRASRAARLRGAMEGLLASIGAGVQPSYNAWIGDRYFAAVEHELGSAAYEQTLAEGRAMSQSQAIGYAMET